MSIFSLVFIIVVHSLAFRATFFSQFDIQSHSQTFKATIEPSKLRSQHSELSIFNLAFRAVVFQFGFQSHILSVHNCLFSIWHSNLFFNLACRTSFQAFRATFQAFKVAFHAFRAVFQAFKVVFQTFKAVFLVSYLGPPSFLVRYSKPLFKRSGPLFKRLNLYFQFGIQSCISSIQSCSFGSLGIQSRCSQFGIHNRFSQFDVHSHCSQFNIQSHPFSSVLAFRVIFLQPCHLESQLPTFIFTSIAHDIVL